MAGAATFTVDVIRGGVIESSHHIDAALCGVDGSVRSWGAHDRPTIPRSAIKAIQALPLVASGAADAYDLSETELALACASHGGEPAHVEAVAAWLARLELSEDDLECGPDLPIHGPSRDDVIRSERNPHPRYNCCSGKHAGFLSVLRHRGERTGGYLDPASPIQREVTEAVATATGIDVADQTPGIDGCGIPVFAFPLANLALAMARLVRPRNLPDRYASAAPRLVAAAQQAFWVAGTDRTETTVADRATEPILVKGGAEGVFMGALPERGLGLALKAADGSSRASQAAVRSLLGHLEATADPEAGDQPIHNKAGDRSGRIEVTMDAPDRSALAGI